MRSRLFVIAVAAPLLFSGVALAQSTPNPSPAPNPQTTASTNQHNAVLTVDKLRQDLQKAGFSDVKVLESAYAVQAKSKDGDPVTMFIGPHGFTAIENLSSNQNNQNSPSNSASATNTHAAPAK
jgi:hypothetical protein